MDSPDNLSEISRNIILDLDSIVCVSCISFWEISIKSAIGKLTLDNYTTEDLLRIAETQMQFQLLSLEPLETASFVNLPKLSHKDPFDRMLIWQVISRDLQLISKDKEFEAYKSLGLKLLW